MQLAYLYLLSVFLIQSISLTPNYTAQYTASSPTYNNLDFISFAPKPLINMHNKLVNTVLCVNGSMFIFVYIDDQGKKGSDNRNVLYQVPERQIFKNFSYNNVDNKIKYMDWIQSGIIVISNKQTILYNPSNMMKKYQIKTNKDVINVRQCYNAEQDKNYVAIQKKNSIYIEIYQDGIKTKLVDKNSATQFGKVVFDHRGRYMYYMGQISAMGGGKFIYDLKDNKKINSTFVDITDQISYYLLASPSPDKNPIEIVITKTGQFIIWPSFNANPITRNVKGIRQSMFRVTNKPYSQYIYTIFKNYSKIAVLRINFQQFDIQLVQEITIPGNGEVSVNDSVRDFDISSNTIAAIISDKQKFRDNMYLSIYRDLGEEKQSGWLWLFVALLVTVLTIVLSIFGWKKGNKCCFYIFKRRQTSLLKQEMRNTINPYASSIQDNNTSERYTSYGDPRNYIEPINLSIPPANQKVQNQELPKKVSQLKLYSNKQQQNQKITDEKKACIKQSNIDVISLSSSSQSKYSIQTQNSKSNISVNKSKQGTTQPQKPKTMFLTKTFNLKPKQKQDYVHVQKQQQQKQAQIQMMSMSQAHSQSHSEKESHSRVKVRDRDNDTSFDIHSQSDKQSINIQFGNMGSDLKDENLML